MRRYRIETDAFGSVRVPADRYHGIQTQRALDAVSPSSLYLPRRFYWALGLVKRSCCEANEALELLDVARAEWIATAAQEVMDGKFDVEFPLDVFQSGSGAAANRNANEVIANRAIELMGGDLGSGDPVDPAAHVDLNQSFFEVIAAATHIAAAVGLDRDLLPALHTLQASLEARADAVPRLAEPLGRCATRVGAALLQAEQARDGLLELVLGSVAAEAAPDQARDLPSLAIERIADEADVAFEAAGPGAAAPGSCDAVLEASGYLAAVADSLRAVATDLHALGPRPLRAGATRAPPEGASSGSTPGDADPTVCAVLAMVCGKVRGNDVAIRTEEQDGNAALTTALPLLAHAVLESIDLLSTGCAQVAQRWADQIEALPGA